MATGMMSRLFGKGSGMERLRTVMAISKWQGRPR